MHNDIKDKKKTNFISVILGYFSRDEITLLKNYKKITLFPHFSSLCNAKLGRKGEEKN